MANEISLTASLTVFKPSIMSSALSRAFTGAFNMAGTVILAGTSVVGTSAGLFGGVTGVNWMYAKNLDPTNFVRFLMNGGLPFLKLYPGYPCFCPIDDTGTLYAQANIAPVEVEFLLMQT